MKQIAITITIFLISISSSLQAQDSLKNFHFTDVYLFAGATDVFNFTLPTVDMEVLKNNSQLFTNNYKKFTPSSRSFYYFHRNISILTGLDLPKFNENKKWQSQIRIGLSFTQSQTLLWNGSNENKGRYDTLFSNVSGEQFFRDTLRHEYLRYQLESQMLGLDASWILKKAFKKRWHLFGGVGAHYNTSINSKASVNHNIVTRYDYYSDFNFWRNDFSPSQNSSETFEAHRMNNFMAYLPLGVEFQLGKDKRELLKHINLVYEARPMFHYSSIDGIGSASNLGFFNQLGIRLSL